MALTPFRGFWDLQSEVDRMFNDIMRGFFGERRGEAAGIWAPPVEAFARDGDLVIHADLPGVALEDVDVTVDGNTLTISGERKPLAGEEVSYYLREAPVGAFRRSMAIPAEVDADSIKATLKDGVLEVVLPGAVAEVQPKKIAIETGGEQKTIEGETS
ncbi:Hsp20/alpha crystallin family protein [Rubrobacter taiwanensis]|jgi:HSP20 family protein|uniref:Hsp20/alpha crystallin family protein n=1 Tax=Rubrobacter taiwanensis TaxID=185139 RepID=A0A4R1BFG4_9ACTN|nr:Hsp20/alpha crystallin family protein [Rubrobacter taiwanensis]TCJ15857.1 Hsp20/alpha crystallin family protein [Rubrobacter taiwanensis]